MPYSHLKILRDVDGAPLPQYVDEDGTLRVLDRETMQEMIMTNIPELQKVSDEDVLAKLEEILMKQGPVTVENWKAVQDVKITNPADPIVFPNTQKVEVTNHKETQEVSGSVNIGNQKEIQKVELTNPKETQGVSGTVDVGNFPLTDAQVKAELVAIKERQAADGTATLQKLSEMEAETIKTNEKLEQFLFNQKEMLNTMQSEKLVFGAYWDKAASPLLTRTDAAVGLTANVGVGGEFVQNDFDRMPIYSEISEVEDELGNVFIRIPKFYIRKRDGADFKVWQISKTKYPGFYLPHVFWDFVNHRELDYFDYGKHVASRSVDNKLESKPGKYPIVSQHIVTMRGYAESNNDEASGLTGYQQLDIHAIDVLQVLFYVEFATLNSQSIMSGFTSGEYSTAHLALFTEEQTNQFVLTAAHAAGYRVGQSIGIGTSRGGNQITDYRTIISIDPVEENAAIVFDGEPLDILEGHSIYNTGYKTGISSQILATSGSMVSNTDGKQPCMYRGIESPWGDVYQFVDGVNFSDHQTWVAKNAKDYASNVFASPYEMLGYVNSEANGYASEMGHDPNNPFAEIPIKTGAGTTTYYADYYYQAAGARIAHFGGSWINGAFAGLSLWYLNTSSASAYLNLGARLLKKAS